MLDDITYGGVRQALDEFDQLGRAEFLQKYGLARPALASSWSAKRYTTQRPSAVQRMGTIDRTKVRSGRLLGVLMPREPDRDLIGLAHHVDASVVWSTSPQDFTVVHPAQVA